MKNIYTAVKIFVNTYSGAALGVPLLLQLTGMVCGVLIHSGGIRFPFGQAVQSSKIAASHEAGTDGQLDRGQLDRGHIQASNL